MSCRHVFPLFGVGFHEIKKVERVSIEVPVYTLFEEDLNLHQFEIFLKEKRVLENDNDVSSNLSIP